MIESKTITLEINGRRREIAAPPNQTLLETLREHGYFEVKSGCEKGDCGDCAVLVDGEAVDSCLTLTGTLEGRAVTTVAGLKQNGELNPLQRAFVKLGSIQCGYCTPGLIIAAQSLLNETPAPSDEDIRLALSGNLCRCTGYTKVFDAVQEAAQALGEEESAS